MSEGLRDNPPALIDDGVRHFFVTGRELCIYKNGHGKCPDFEAEE